MRARHFLEGSLAGGEGKLLGTFDDVAQALAFWREIRTIFQLKIKDEDDYDSD